jgi:hypothetical protein
MPIYTSVLMTLKVAQDSGLESLLLHRDREAITDTYDESVSGTVDIAASTTFTVPMTHLTEGQFLYVETTREVRLHFSGGVDDVPLKPATAGTKVRHLQERTSFTSLTIENAAATDEATGVFFMVLGT